MHAERGAAITMVIAMVLIIGILGNGLFGAGIRAVQEREANILRRYKVTPISPAPLLVASVVTGWILYHAERDSDSRAGTFSLRDAVAAVDRRRF